MVLKYAGDTKTDSLIVCPYCEHKYHDSSEFSNDEQDWSDNIECEGCGKTFEASLVISVDYSMSRNCELNKEDHEWEESWWDKGGNMLTCKKCGYNTEKEKANGK